MTGHDPSRALRTDVLRGRRPRQLTPGGPPVAQVATASSLVVPPLVWSAPVQMLVKVDRGRGLPSGCQRWWSWATRPPALAAPALGDGIVGLAHVAHDTPALPTLALSRDGDISRLASSANHDGSCFAGMSATDRGGEYTNVAVITGSGDRQWHTG